MQCPDDGDPAVAQFGNDGSREMKDRMDMRDINRMLIQKTRQPVSRLDVVKAASRDPKPMQRGPRSRVEGLRQKLRGGRFGHARRSSRKSMHGVPVLTEERRQLEYVPFLPANHLEESVNAKDPHAACLRDIPPWSPSGAAL